MKRISIRKSKSSKVSPSESKSLKRLSFPLSVLLLFVVSVALFAASGRYWYKHVLTDPNRTISDMLEKSMQTTSVTRTVSQSSGINTSDENIYVEFTPKTSMQSQTTLKEVSQTGKTTAVIEKIGDAKTDYVRYNKIEITGNGQPQRNFSSVLGIWGKRDSNPESGGSSTFLNNELFTAIPFGNLNESQRKAVKDEIKNVNLYKYSDYKTEIKNGRPVSTFMVEMNPSSLVKVLAKYVQVTGVGTSASLDPSAYEGAENIRLRVSVDVLSRHLKSIQYINTDRTENYVGYNVRHQIVTPKDTVSVDELQAKLQAVEPTQQ